MSQRAATERITLSAADARDARGTATPRDATLLLELPDGTHVPLPASLQATMLRTLDALSQGRAVTIGPEPDELTSSAAADFLGVSRPTLMKWARSGRIASFTVGSHTRFRLADVKALQNQRIAEREAAFDELRSFDHEHAEAWDE